MTQNPILKRVRFRHIAVENRLSTEYIYHRSSYVLAALAKGSNLRFFGKEKANLILHAENNNQMEFKVSGKTFFLLFRYQAIKIFRKI